MSDDLDPNDLPAVPDNVDTTDELSKVADVTKWQTTQNLAEMIQKKRVGTELWKYLAFIVLALATAETILAHFFSKAK